MAVLLELDDTFLHFSMGPDELTRLRATLLTEAERAQACIRIGDQVPFHGPIGGRPLLNKIIDDPVVEALEGNGGNQYEGEENHHPEEEEQHPDEAEKEEGQGSGRNQVEEEGEAEGKRIKDGRMKGNGTTNGRDEDEEGSEGGINRMEGEGEAEGMRRMKGKETTEAREEDKEGSGRNWAEEVRLRLNAARNIAFNKTKESGREREEKEKGNIIRASAAGDQ